MIISWYIHRLALYLETKTTMHRQRSRQMHNLLTISISRIIMYKYSFGKLLPLYSQTHKKCKCATTNCCLIYYSAFSGSRLWIWKALQFFIHILRFTATQKVLIAGVALLVLYGKQNVFEVLFWFCRNGDEVYCIIFISV